METISRREWMGLAGLSALGMAGLSGPLAVARAEGPSRPGLSTEPYRLPDLPYPALALEPHLDVQTLTLHHGKHHAAYVQGLNDALAKLDEARRKGDYSAVRALSQAVAFHGSGHLLHTLYFANLHPKPTPPKGELLSAIHAQFGSLEALIAQLSAATNAVAGSGWGLLAYEPFGRRLIVLQVEKHENQVFCGAVPLLVIDVWEHAYYLTYQNRRADYVKAILNVIHWEEVERRFNAALK